MNRNQAMTQNETIQINHDKLQTAAGVVFRNITQTNNKADFKRFIDFPRHNHKFTRKFENKANIRHKAMVKFNHLGREHKMLATNRANKNQKRQKRLNLTQGNT